MSRSVNGIPYDVWIRRVDSATRKVGGLWYRKRQQYNARWYPGPWGDAWCGRKSASKRKNRQLRARIREALHHERWENMPEVRNSVRWETW
jgi:hypothetical protein